MGDWYEANPGVLDGPQSICWWIRNDREWPAEGVQDPRVIDEARQRREAKEAAKRAETAAAAESAEQSRDDRAALERKYGAELDSLSPDERDEFARLALDGYQYERFRRNPDAPMSRYDLLVAIFENRDAG